MPAWADAKPPPSTPRRMGTPTRWSPTATASAPERPPDHHAPDDRVLPPALCTRLDLGGLTPGHRVRAIPPWRRRSAAGPVERERSGRIGSAGTPWREQGKQVIEADDSVPADVATAGAAARGQHRERIREHDYAASVDTVRHTQRRRLVLAGPHAPSCNAKTQRWQDGDSDCGHEWTHDPSLGPLTYLADDVDRDACATGAAVPDAATLISRTSPRQGPQPRPHSPSRSNLIEPTCPIAERDDARRAPNSAPSTHSALEPLGTCFAASAMSSISRSTASVVKSALTNAARITRRPSTMP